MNKTGIVVLAVLLLVFGLSAVFEALWNNRAARTQAQASAAAPGPGVSSPANAATPPAAASRAAATPRNAGAVPQMTIKELGHFEYDAVKGGDIPEDVIARDGTAIKLRGYVMAALQAGSLTDFVLVPSYFNCCYGLPPGVQHVVIVRLMPKDAIKYTTDEVWVQGILHVNVVRDDGYTTQIFSLDGESVTPVAP